MAGRDPDAGRRAAGRAATRLRIVEAARTLHREVGPIATTVSAVAERADVQRLTVYRHFPSERDLLDACSALTLAQRPPPDPRAWSSETEPRRRAARLLDDLYGWYATDPATLEHMLRDAETDPQVAAVMAPLAGFLEGAAASLGEGADVPEPERRLHHAACRHAVAFATWRSLAAAGLDTADAVELMLGFLDAAEGVARRRLVR